MKTFAERLKLAIEKRKLSQAEAARKCGISQQSINYIINNNLSSSKLAPKIAASLNINTEWLIYGRGRFEEIKIYELPILHSPYMIKKFLVNDLDDNSLKYTIMDCYLGSNPFAYILEPSKMIICADINHKKPTDKYLTFSNSSVEITNVRKEVSFAIVEWRIRDETF